jgi:hypothetical protein
VAFLAESDALLRASFALAEADLVFEALLMACLTRLLFYYFIYSSKHGQ